jgi:Xaa-Pro aminopeptidase
MTESALGAIWNGWVHEHGTGWDGGKVDLAHGFSLVWTGKGIRTFTATGSRPVEQGKPTLFEIWVVADGYWCDHTKNLVVGELEPRYAELERGLTDVYGAAVDFARPGASLAELDSSVRAGLAEIGYPGQPTHPICHGVGARAHEPPYAHQAGGGTIDAGMILAIEPGVYWPEGGGLRVEDNFLVADGGAEKLCSFPDGIVSAG